MRILRRMRLGITPALLLLVLAPSSLADTVRLKDGGIIKGRVTGFNGGDFVVSIGEGSRRRELRFAASDVDSIQFDNQTDSTATSMPPSPPVSYKATVAKTPATAGEAKNTEPVRQQPVSSPEIRTNSEPSIPQNRSASGSIKPIEVKVRVLADNTSNGWTNSGWVVKKGQRILITAQEGTVSLGKGRSVSPSGDSSFEDDRKLLKAVPTGALLAVIGDDNNDFIYIGSQREFIATRDGALFLGINDGDLSDNSGAFNVRVEIFPG